MHISISKVIPITILVTCAILTSTHLNAKAPEIKILTLDWTSQIVVSYIVGDLLQKTGYSVGYLPEAAESQWFLLGSELANLQVEIWEGSMAKDFKRLEDRGLILSAGDHEALTREEWWYPDYVKEKCPGLPDWQSLKECSGIFSDGDSLQGKYFTGPWEKPDRARVRSLGLSIEVVTLKDSDALRARLETAILARRPILIFNWTPNWVESIYDGEFVEFPVHEPACETEAAWGINKNLNWDCGNPKRGWLKKAVSRNFPVTWPCAFKLLENISFNNKQISDAAALVEVNGYDYSTAAKYWLASNKIAWNSWIAETDCNITDDKVWNE